ncbi:hypothetical protein HYC85_004323 [Camellia sinensis]|uniref:Btz domain-containing protein n=1 Tax=Camellia sinensis TaxID=4442 RepID=A0A7J7HYW4_CAMSI|nr:hypothetical protein HYC85_004323 [Camellia sinensis]
MAAAGEEEVEYESDPEEAKRLLRMRRREASDDEDEEERERPLRRIDSRAAIGSDGESDGQGAAAEYDDEESEIEEEELEEKEEVEVEADVVEEAEHEVRGGKDSVEIGSEDEKELDGDAPRSVGESMELLQGVNQVEEEKKENEPFAVPTAGAFYMHDDRFRDNAGGGRHRRTLGERKLWESKDDRKWGHDKFEEMTLQERRYEKGTRNSRGHYRPRGKNRGADRGFPRVNKSKAYDNNTQNHAPKGFRGRGPRRYEPSRNNSEAPQTQLRNQLRKLCMLLLGEHLWPHQIQESNPVPARKQVFASSLNYASPPFYPSLSSNKETTLTQNKDVQAGTTNRNLRSAVMDENFSVSQSNTMMRGKDVVDSIGMEKLYINDSSIIPNLFDQGLREESLVPSGQMTCQPGAPHSQVTRASPPNQLHTVQRNPVQSRVQPSFQASVQSPGSGSQTTSPPKAALSINYFEPGELESPPESSKSKNASIGIGKGSVQGSGRGSFLYGGTQVMGASGNMGSGHGDQNFPGTPAFLPVMPFSGQHSGGMGVPAVGMAFPGYVAQPQLGLGNSEMTWLPVLAGAAGALGTTYCSPYIAVDGAYHSRPSGKTSSSEASSKEDNTNKPNNEWKASQRPACEDCWWASSKIK